MISSLSCHGNPLHPDEAFALESHETWRKTARLAVELGVDVVTTFSGCPATAPTHARRTGSRAPGRPSTARPSSGSGTRWRSRTGATKLRSRARPACAKIALEAHPGFLVYNPETVLRLREAAGPEIGANFDPSHFVWQGIDPLAAVRMLGKAGAIFHVHAKDVYLDRANISVNGVLDTKHYGRFAERSWSFRSVGYGQDEKFWRDFVSALRIAGYDGVLSIEHEDGLLSIDEGLGKAVEVLQRVLLRELPGEMWWA